MKTISAQEAVGPIASGQRVFVGSGAAQPQGLVEALAAKADRLADTEVVHLLTLGTAPYAQERFQRSLRHNALFIGPNVRDAVQKGLADYTPCFLHEIPSLFRSGRLPVDAALIQVAPPRGRGCSLGVSVDVVKAAVEAADYVAAQVNPRMPWTLGDSCVDAGDIDAFVFQEEELCELPAAEPTAAALWIGRYIASLVRDGDTLQLGIGAIPDAVLAALAGKKDLGVHTEMISEGLLPLIAKGVINGRRKTLLPGKIVGAFCLGSRRLYDAVADNPLFELRPVDFTNDPFVIARNERFVSINSALQVDLTGQVAADSIGRRLYSGVGGQVDFIRGAARSRGGRAIIALPSAARGGTVSRIVPLLDEGAGVVTTRADVDYVVTEYGIASLKGKSLRQRAVALIQAAHPKFRAGLLAAAKKSGLLEAGRTLPLEAPRYAVEVETRRRFGDLEVFFRPITPSDERRLKELFYSQSPDTTYLRFGMALKRLSERQFQELVAIDYVNSMAIGGFVREGGRERLIAVARYYAEEGEPLAEAAFTVHDRYQGRGIGTFLVNYLAWIAQERGLKGFTAQVLTINERMLGALRRSFKKMDLRRQDGAILCTALFSDWLGLAEQDPEFTGQKRC